MAIFCNFILISRCLGDLNTFPTFRTRELSWLNFGLCLCLLQRTHTGYQISLLNSKGTLFEWPSRWAGQRGWKPNNNILGKRWRWSRKMLRKWKSFNPILKIYKVKSNMQRHSKPSPVLDPTSVGRRMFLSGIRLQTAIKGSYLTEFFRGTEERTSRWATVTWS